MKILLIITSILIFSELIFRLYYHIATGHCYHVSIKFPWKRTHVVTHPFLSFAYKRNEVIDRNQPLPYDLHYHKYHSYKYPLRLNNMGHFGEDFSFEKPDNVLRVACLGASTTANNIADKNRDYSYPKILQDLLNAHFKKNGFDKQAEVYNCGIGGWVSADILIDFMLNVIYTKPDYVVLYHGLNDLPLYLTDDFLPDYSHGRKNLGEVLPVIKRAYYFPKIRFWHLYEFLKDKILGTGNVRNDVLALITKQKPVISRKFRDLTVEKDILKNILILCKHHSIKCILSSFAYYCYRNDAVTIKYAEGVNIENKLRRELAEEFDVPFVDQATLIPLRDEFFVDTVHLSAEGMTILAENFYREIISNLKHGGIFNMNYQDAPQNV